MLKLVLIDLDETFLRSDKTYDRDRFDKVRQGLQEQGTLICICTGNSYHKIEDYFQEEDMQDIYFACDNGNFIVKNEETLEIRGIAHEDILEMLDFIDDLEDYYPLYGAGDVSYFRQAQGWGYEHISRYNNNLEIVDSFHDLPEGTQATKLAIASPRSLDENKTLARIINNRYDFARAVTSGDNWLDVYHIEGGKGSAARYLMDKYEIDSQEAMAFGDSMNDESMMEEVGYSVAMGNADPELAVTCKFQIGSNEDQSVLHVLERYLEEGSLDFMADYQQYS